MAIKKYGNALTSAVTEKNVVEKTPTGSRQTVTLICDWNSRGANTPTLGTTLDSRPLVSASQEQISGDLCRLTLVYENAIVDLTSIPATTYDEETSYIELPIQQHPSFTSWSADWDDEKGEFLPTSALYGITSYIVGSTVVTKTEYSSSQPSSNYNSVGSLSAPGGGYSGSDHWMIIGTSRRKLGDGLYARETKYLYSAKSYPSAIYG